MRDVNDVVPCFSLGPVVAEQTVLSVILIMCSIYKNLRT